MVAWSWQIQMRRIHLSIQVFHWTSNNIEEHEAPNEWDWNHWHSCGLLQRISTRCIQGAKSDHCPRVRTIVTAGWYPKSKIFGENPQKSQPTHHTRDRHLLYKPLVHHIRITVIRIEGFTTVKTTTATQEVTFRSHRANNIHLNEGTKSKYAHIKLINNYDHLRTIIFHI